ncbi:MAG TPA: hypothetical protein VFA26_16815 [Gemmataceae bacterium]|nr:hypothetical protein [Gemmataceae bacterium]
MMCRNRQMGVTVVVWLVCLVGAAVALVLKGGPLWTAPLPAGSAVAAAEPEPEAAPPAASGEAETARKEFVGPPEPTGAADAPTPEPAPPEPAKLPDPPAPQANLMPPVQPCPPVPQSPEPPVACRTYQVAQTGGETFRDVARAALGSGERWHDIYRLNPSYRPEFRIPAGTILKVPEAGSWHPTIACSARASADAAPAVQPIPAFAAKAPARTASRSKGVPFTGTHPCCLDDHCGLVLPAAVREQFGRPGRVLLTPGPDGCLYLCAPAHAEGLVEKLGRAGDPARAVRLYFSRTEKAAVGSDGRLAVPDALAAHAGLRCEAVLVGAGDHFELWDAGRWREYAARGTHAPPARKRPTAHAAGGRAE